MSFTPARPARIAPELTRRVGNVALEHLAEHEPDAAAYAGERRQPELLERLNRGAT